MESPFASIHGRSACVPLFSTSRSAKVGLARHIACSLSQGIGDTFNAQFAEHIAVPILLRDVPLDKMKSLRDVINHLFVRAKHDQGKRLHVAQLEEFVSRGLAIVVLDGLDELGSLERRSRILHWLSEYMAGVGSSSSLSIIVTGRPSAFEGLAQLAAVPHVRLHVAPFSKEQIREFLRRWFELRPIPPERRAQQSEELVERLMGDREMDQLRILARRPAYLTSLAFVHGTRGALPHTRAALYESLVEAYIETLDRQRGLKYLPPWDRQEKKDVLAAVAFSAHVGATRASAQGDRRLTWTRGEFTNAVREALEQGGPRFRTLSVADADSLAEYYIARTGLLVESSEGVYQFGHLSFQEYLSALYAIDHASGARSKTLAFSRMVLDRLSSPGWLEVAILALAIDAGRTRGTGHRALLGVLKLEDSGHVALLGHILSGEELPLEQRERDAWLLAWMLYASWFPDRGAGPARLGRNRAAIEGAWVSVAEAVVAGASPMGAVLDRLRQEVAQAPTDDQGDLTDPFEATRRIHEEASPTFADR